MAVLRWPRSSAVAGLARSTLTRPRVPTGRPCRRGRRRHRTLTAVRNDATSMQLLWNSQPNIRDLRDHPADSQGNNEGRGRRAAGGADRRRIYSHSPSTASSCRPSGPGSRARCPRRSAPVPVPPRRLRLPLRRLRPRRPRYRHRGRRTEPLSGRRDTCLFRRVGHQRRQRRAERWPRAHSDPTRRRR